MKDKNFFFKSSLVNRKNIEMAKKHFLMFLRGSPERVNRKL